MRQTDKYAHVWCLVVIHTHSFRSFSACSLHPHKLHSMHFAKIKLFIEKVVCGMPDNSKATAAEMREKKRKNYDDL